MPRKSTGVRAKSGMHVPGEGAWERDSWMRKTLAAADGRAHDDGRSGGAASARPERTPERCAKPEDITAMQAAAVQQQLMVAALSCDSISSTIPSSPAISPSCMRRTGRLLKFFQAHEPRGGEAGLPLLQDAHGQHGFDSCRSTISGLSAPTPRRPIQSGAGPDEVDAGGVRRHPADHGNEHIETCEFRVAGGIVPHAPPTCRCPS